MIWKTNKQTNKAKEAKREKLDATPPRIAITGCPGCNHQPVGYSNHRTQFPQYFHTAKSSRSHSQGILCEKITHLVEEVKRPSRSADLPMQQLLASSREATNQCMDVLLRPCFLCSSRITFILIWARQKKTVNRAEVTLLFLPFPNNTNFKGILVASCFHDEEASSAAPEFTLGKKKTQSH